MEIVLKRTFLYSTLTVTRWIRNKRKINWKTCVFRNGHMKLIS